MMGALRKIFTVHHRDQNVLEEIKKDCVLKKEGSSSNPSQFITVQPSIILQLATSLGICM